MATETLLVKTKDNSVIVLSVTYNNAAEKMRLTKQCEQYCQSVNYEEFNSSGLPLANVDFDSVNTEFLKNEIHGYHYIKEPENFVNEMKDNNFPAKVKKSNTLHFDCRMDDDFFPEMIRNVAYHVMPEDEIYKVRYNSKENKYEVVDFKIKRAQVNHSRKEITIVRNHFRFEPNDYAKLQSMINDYKKELRNNPKITPKDYAYSIRNQKDYSLFSIYAIEQENVNHLDATIEHELKHVKNSIFMDGLELKDSYRQLSLDNMYRLSVENERSAYMQQLIHCINKYLKQGDFNDFSMFDGESLGCANYLRSLKTKDERIAFVTDLPLLTEKMLEQFKTKHKKYYDEKQFANNVMNLAERAPLSAQKDVEGKTFRKLRSLYYNYMIYNPHTGKEENISLAKYIMPDMEVEISDEVRRNIIDPAEQKLRNRLDEFNRRKNRGDINTALVAPAKALMRGGVNYSSFINEVDGLSIGRLFDEEEKPQPTPVADNSSAPKSPNDYASWSDDLKKYWSKVDGYFEIEKNNREYTFKIREVQISYSDKNHVNVSSNADFELYVKLLKEPSTKNNVIEFAPTLSEEQALLLYIACTNYGHKMSGKVPTDLSGIDNLLGVPPEEMNKFNHRSGRSVNQQVSQQVSQNFETPRLQRRNQGR